MLGYCNDPRCAFDLWSPSRFSAIENRAFSLYCYHEQQLMDIAERIANRETKLDLDEPLTETDIEELNRLLRERGLEGRIVLS